jgi:hypothetical protein
LVAPVEKNFSAALNEAVDKSLQGHQRIPQGRLIRSAPLVSGDMMLQNEGWPDNSNLVAAGPMFTTCVSPQPSMSYAASAVLTK